MINWELIIGIVFGYILGVGVGIYITRKGMIKWKQNIM